MGSLSPTLSPSLRLPGFTRDICIVIAQDNCIPDIFSKLDAEIVSPKTPPHEWVGMTGYKMNLFSQQFMKFQEVLQFGLLKLPPETPPLVWGGVGQIVLGSNDSRINPHMRAKFGCSQKVLSKKKRGVTDRHTHTRRVKSHGLPVSLTDFGNFSRLTAGTHNAHGYL